MSGGVFGKDEKTVITPNGGFHLFKNNSKGFEICQQYYHLQQYRNCNGNGNVMRPAGYGVGGGTNCQDCGNQAKKDCQYMRCRTCCKSRGFQCQTHVKSTWVPAAKRRERQQLSLMMRGGGGDQNLKRLREDQVIVATTDGGGGGGGGGGGAVGVNLPSTHHQIVSSGLEIGRFPAEANSPAVFRCVRVTSMGEVDEQLAYQTTISIGGHFFRGILYDHGPEGQYDNPGAGGNSSAGGSIAQHQQPNLITSSTVNPNATTIDTSSICPTPLNAFMVGTQFFQPPRS